MELRNFKLAVKERKVAAHQFISHFDREVDRPGIGDAFVFPKGIAAATLVGLPPMARAGFLSFAIELPRAATGHSELCIDLAATGNRSINAQMQFGHPTAGFEISFVRTERESGDLHRVFGDGRLVLRT